MPSQNANRQIVFTQKNRAELSDCPYEPPKEDEVVVETLYSTISNGTERTNLTGDTNISIYAELKEATFPRTAGYSASGRVAEVGSNVTSVRPGDAVVLSWSKHKKFNTLEEKNVVKFDPAKISFADAALCHIGTFSMAALRKTGLEIGESILVMGLGILGQQAVMFAHAAGAVPVIAADPLPERREKAAALGADCTLDPTRSDFAERVKAMTSGGVNAAIEVTGLGSGLNECLDCMARFGRIALLGCTRDKNFTVDYYRKVHGPGVSLIGAHTAARPQADSSRGFFTQRDDISSILKLLEHKRIDYSALRDRICSPADCSEIYRSLAEDKDFPVCVQFSWEGIK